MITGTSKFLDPSSFAVSIERYHLLPKGGVSFVAHILPVIELILGLSILINLHKRFSLFSTLALLTVFQAALFSVIIRNIDTDCGCLGNLIRGNNHRLSIIVAIIRNFLLLALSIILLRTKQEKSAKNESE